MVQLMILVFHEKPISLPVINLLAIFRIVIYEKRYFLIFEFQSTRFISKLHCTYLTIALCILKFLYNTIWIICFPFIQFFVAVSNCTLPYNIATHLDSHQYYILLRDTSIYRCFSYSIDLNSDYRWKIIQL